MRRSKHTRPAPRSKTTHKPNPANALTIRLAAVGLRRCAAMPTRQVVDAHAANHGGHDRQVEILDDALLTTAHTGRCEVDAAGCHRDGHTKSSQRQGQHQQRSRGWRTLPGEGASAHSQFDNSCDHGTTGRRRPVSKSKVTRPAVEPTPTAKPAAGTAISMPIIRTRRLHTRHKRKFTAAGLPPQRSVLGLILIFIPCAVDRIGDRPLEHLALLSVRSH